MNSDVKRFQDMMARENWYDLFGKEEIQALFDLLIKANNERQRWAQRMMRLEDRLRYITEVANGHHEGWYQTRTYKED